jgi:hypothetical protein
MTDHLGGGVLLAFKILVLLPLANFIVSVFKSAALCDTIEAAPQTAFDSGISPPAPTSAHQNMWFSDSVRVQAGRRIDPTL